MQCPSCHKEVDVKDKDVGALYTCPLCRSVYFINFDGTPEYGEVLQPSEEELKKLQNMAVPEKKKKKKKKDQDDEPEQHEAESPVQPEQAISEVPPVDFSQPAEIPEFEMQSVDNGFSLNEIPQDSGGFEPVMAETIEVVSEPPPIEAFPSETPSIENFSYESAPPAANENESAPQDFNAIASEIESFGNRQTVVAGISYDLEITGLDTKEAQELLREAIDDSRFGWHPEDIVREIRKGTCTFKNLTPVQAFVLARRIQFIDVDMKWKQNVLA